MKSRLTKTEKEIEKDIASGKLRSVSKLKRDEIVAAAKHHIEVGKKEERVNIRMSTEVLELVREAAAREGLPYQTFIASTLFKVATGQFVTRKQWEELLERISKKAS